MKKAIVGVVTFIMSIGITTAWAQDDDGLGAAAGGDPALERACTVLQANLEPVSVAKAKAAEALAAATKAEEEAAKGKAAVAAAQAEVDAARSAVAAAKTAVTRARTSEEKKTAAAAKTAAETALADAEAKSKAPKAEVAKADEAWTKAKDTAAAAKALADTKAAGDYVIADRFTAARCFAAARRGGVQGGGPDIASTLIATAGQIVIDRATGVAWNLLAKKLKQAAGCDEKDATKDRLPATCTVLRDVRLQDLLASPGVLLDAAVKDLIAKIGERLKKELPCRAFGDLQVCPGEILHAGLLAWRDGGVDALEESLRSQLSALAIDALAMKGLDAHPAIRGAGLFARCALTQKKLAPLAECPLVVELSAEERAAILPYAALVDAAVRVRTRGAVIDAAAAVVLELYPDSQPVIDGVENVLAGLTAKDWSKVSAGAIAIIHYYVKKKQDEPARGVALAFVGSAAGAGLPPLPDFVDQDTKLYRLLASVGQYAATYINKDTDPEAANKARREAIEALIDSMTDRSQRTEGGVFSVGGAFGIGYGQRMQGDQDASGTPFHLAFGFAYDRFCGDNWGVHAMASLVDASQYVAFEDADFSVVDPDAKSSLAIGGTLGIWFAEKQTPLFIAGNFTYAPFVDIDTTDMKARGSYQVMGLVGVYVPFIDFN